MYRMGQEEKDAVARVIDSKQLFKVNDGPLKETENCEREIREMFNVKRAVLMTSGTASLTSALIGMGVGPGDEVIIPEPSFVCYNPLVKMVGGVPVTIDLKEENEFRLTADELKEKITDKTKLLILPFPSNPTGAIMEKADLEAIAEVLEGTDIMVLSDEIYSELTYGRKHCSIASLEGMRERTIMVNGFSKASTFCSIKAFTL